MPIRAAAPAREVVQYQPLALWDSLREHQRHPGCVLLLAVARTMAHGRTQLEAEGEHATGTQEPEKPQSHFHSKVGTAGQGCAAGASHSSPNAGQHPSHHHTAARKAVSRAQNGAGKGILLPKRLARQSGEQEGRLSRLETCTPVL